MTDETNSFFSNPQLATEILPRQEQVDFIPIRKTYRTIILINLCFFLGLMLVGWMIMFLLAGSNFTFNIFLIGSVAWAVMSVLIVLRLFKVFGYRKYAIRKHDIIYKKGWLWRSTTTVPFARVQHCDIKQGIFERYFELSKLNVYTAGGQNSDLTIPGLKLEEAEQYKRYILKTIASDEEE